MEVFVLGGLAILFLIGKYSVRKPESFSKGTVSPAEKNGIGGQAYTKKPRTIMEKLMEGKPSFRTYEQVQEENLRRIIKPGYDPWSPENRDRTQAINDLLEKNKAIAKKEMEEEIAREQATPPLLTVEAALSELRSKQGKQP